MNHFSWANALAYVYARLLEKSTWAGIVSFAVGCGFLSSSSPLVDQLPQLGVMAIGILAAAVPTKPTPAADPAKVQSHALIPLLGVAILASALLGGCMWTDSQGNQVVLTPQNATPLIVDKMKQVCAAYDANKVSYDALAAVATQAINNATVTGANNTVRDIATQACPLLESVIKETVTPAPTPAASTPAPKPAPASSSPASG